MNKPRKRLQTSVALKLPFRRKYFSRFATGLILLVWTSLYLPNLGTTPRWYGDETITLSCGQDLVHGVFANRATWNTYMNPQFCYQPGYVFLVGLASTVSHQNIAWPRFLNALCALGIALVALRVLGRRFGLLTTLSIGLLFLTYEQSVIHFRWVYAHNAVALGLFICFCFQTIPIRKHRSWGAGIGLAIAAASHPLALQGGLAAFLNRWNQPRTWLPLFVPPLAVGLLSLSPIFLWKPDWLIHDIFELKDFYGSFTQDLGAGWQWPINFWNFFTHDWFHILALASALFLPFFSVSTYRLSLHTRSSSPHSQSTEPPRFLLSGSCYPTLASCRDWLCHRSVVKSPSLAKTYFAMASLRSSGTAILLSSPKGLHFEPYFTE